MLPVLRTFFTHSEPRTNQLYAPHIKRRNRSKYTRTIDEYDSCNDKLPYSNYKVANTCHGDRIESAKARKRTAGSAYVIGTHTIDLRRIAWIQRANAVRRDVASPGDCALTTLQHYLCRVM